MRWVVGTLLVGAAVLKAVQLITDPAAAVLNPLGRYFLPVQISVELALGLLLLSGLYWRTLRWVVAALFTVFAGYSFYLAVGGAASCGCFGGLRVNPWWTFALDVAVLVGLLSASFHREPTASESRAVAVSSGLNELAARGRQSHRAVLSHHYVLTAVLGVFALSTALLFRYAGQQTAVAGGLLTTVGDLVILEPETWIGETLPIAKSIDVDLSAGDWIVLLHRHDCQVCLEQVPRYAERAAAGERIALIEVPPYGSFDGREKACKYGRLKEDREWFVQTPVEIRLVGGRVTAVMTYEH